MSRPCLSVAHGRFSDTDFIVPEIIQLVNEAVNLPMRRVDLALNGRPAVGVFVESSVWHLLGRFVGKVQVEWFPTPRATGGCTVVV